MRNVWQQMYDQFRPRTKRAPRQSIKSRARRPITKPPARPRPSPTRALKTSPASAPNSHAFLRSYDFVLSVGVEDTSNNVLLNADSTYQIIKLQARFNKLPDFDEFKALYSEYKISSLLHTLTPFFSQNVGFSTGPQNTADYGIAIPNFEIIVLPVNSSARQTDLHLLNKEEIDAFVNQSVRKTKKILPSGKQYFKQERPTVVDYTGPLSKNAGTAAMAMDSPGWYNTDPAALVTGGVDQTAITHYSHMLLLRRVDGLALNSYGATQNFYQSMGFRQETCVKFSCRKIQ